MVSSVENNTPSGTSKAKVEKPCSNIFQEVSEKVGTYDFIDVGGLPRKADS